MNILGLDVITLSLIVAISGTILHQARMYNGKPLPKILDGVMVTIGGSFVAAHTILINLGSTDQYLQVLTIIGLIGGTVPAGILSQKVFTKTKQKIVQSKSKDKKSILVNIIPKDTVTPELSPKDSWYQNNFVPSDKGNSLNYGQIHLWIRIKDVRSYVTAVLTDANGIRLQVDQSHEFDEDNNIETTRLELIKADGTPFPKGIYHLKTRGDRGTGDSMGIKNDTFEII